MPPKPAPKIAEPGVGYLDSAGQAVKPAVALLTAEQQDYLREAMVDFEELEEEAQEEGLPPPAPLAKKAALKFLHKAIREAPRPYAVSMWDNGTVVVYTQDARTFRVSVYFRAEGGASCYATCADGTKTEDRHYAPTEKVANEWVLDTLRKLKA